MRLSRPDRFRAVWFTIMCAAAFSIACEQPTPPRQAAPAAALQAPTNVIVRISGGNAIVMSGNGSAAVVGPVAKRPGSPADYNDHEMDFLLEVGKQDTGAQFAKEDGDYKGLSYWRTTGYDIQLCEDVNCTPGTLAQPAPAPPSTKCIDGTVSNGSLDYVPNLSALHPGSQMVADWRDRLGTRLTLTRGQIVTTDIVECFEFRDARNKVIRHDSLANGHHGVMNRFSSTAKFIDVVFSQSGKIVKTVRVAPENGSIELSLYPTGHPENDPSDNLKAGDPVTRFAPFYDLLDPATLTGGRLKLTFAPTQTPTPKPRLVNPGPECPMFTFTAP
jgi:hypothetical protein